MTVRQITGFAFAALLAGIGLSFIWTGVYFAWDLYVQPWTPTYGEQEEFVPIPVLGYLAFYFLLRMGAPAPIAVFLLGIAALVAVYVLFRRLR